MKHDLDSEWLEADGLGGFAMGTVGGTRTRRYHATLITATNPPTRRMMLVGGFDAWVQTDQGHFSISSQSYLPGVVHPDGATRVADFSHEPWPTWRYRLEDGNTLIQELFMAHGAPLTAICWRLAEPRVGSVLTVCPFLAGRDYHALHVENDAFRMNVETSRRRVYFRPYEDVPGIVAYSNGQYGHEPTWYRNFFYGEEKARGLDCVEDLVAPGWFRFDLGAEAVLMLGVEGTEAESMPRGSSPEHAYAQLREEELRRREQFESPLQRAADLYLVKRGAGRTIIAGYPWFTDWGRDTFISLRGLCLSTGRFEMARQVLLEWAGCISQGMLPNRFPDVGDAPDYNSVDASLWFVIAAFEYLRGAEAAGLAPPQQDQARLQAAILAILAGYKEGTRHGIHMEADGLLACGEPGVQLTWMDAKVNNWVVTPRGGKPVEVQALWLNALWIGGFLEPQWLEHLRRGRETFNARFWNAERNCLFDVIDCDHEPGKLDGSLRPNQILAMGGLPLPLLEDARTRRALDVIERELLTPMGLRSLGPGESDYAPCYQGGMFQRDAAYHQGTAWPWLMGPFIDAWIRVHGATSQARSEARRRFVEPLLDHLRVAGLGHISEIADGQQPYLPRGCPFQAWSLAELLRVTHGVLAERQEITRPRAELDPRNLVSLGSES